MELFVFLVLILVFFAWPTYALIVGEMSIRGIIIKKEDTPLYFYSNIGFFYFCGIAFPCIMWQVPYSGIFLPIMGVIVVVMIVFWIFKL